MAKHLRLRGSASGSRKLAAPVAVLAVLMSPQCRADWRITPSVDLRETYSDNVRLEADQFARSQFITDLAPSLAVANNGPRLKLTAAFTTHLYAYSNERLDGTNSSQRQLAANAKAKLIEDLLFFDATGSIAQQAVSAFGPQVADNGYADTNRTEVRTWRLSPYLAHHFGSAATAELRYSRDSVKSGDASLEDSTGNTVSTSISSGTAFRTIGWGLHASHADIDSSRSGESTEETASAQLSWRVSDTLSLNVNRGYDKYDYKALAGSTAGPSYSLGMVWAPSTRTQLQASVGKRYFGDSYSLDATHRSRHSVWSITYNDAVTTTRGQFLQPVTIDTAALLNGLFAATISDPVARQQAVDAYIRSNNLPALQVNNTNAFSNRYFLQKEFRASTGFSTARTVTLFSLSATRRTALSIQEGDVGLPGNSLADLNDNTKLASAVASVNYKISPRSAAILTLSKTRTESLTTGIKDDQLLLSVGMTKQLQQKLKGAIELHRAQGNALTLGGRTYHENAVTASLSYQL
jgi:uncharacterized protein (PEP-CTERM system associated)